MNNHRIMQTIVNEFEAIGGVFVQRPRAIVEKLSQIKAFVFDWDGVFNDATKNANNSSNFNEADSMGTNLLRYAHFYKNNEMPLAAIISGEKNEQAFYFAQREHFQSAYYKVAHKIDALQHFCHEHELAMHEVCYFFDDVLDLSIASACGLRILINRKANPLFKHYVVQNNMADYVTGHESGNFAVREACEMLIGLTGNYDAIMRERTNYHGNYKAYITQRQSLPTHFFTVSEQGIEETPRP